MALALTLGRRGLGNAWPNPAVGAVVVRNGMVMGRGWTQPGGRPHAEVEALRRAGEAARGATLYCTLEPCSHHGKTPPLRAAITGDAALTRVHRMRAMHDAVVTGIGTVLSDDPQLTCRLPGMGENSPVRVVMDSALRLPADSRLARSATRTLDWVFVDANAT